MNDSQTPPLNLPDAEKVAQTMARIAEQSQRIVADFMQRQASGERPYNVLDPLVVGRAFQQLTAQMMSDPAKVLDAQIKLWQDYVNLW